MLSLNQQMDPNYYGYGYDSDSDYNSNNYNNNDHDDGTILVLISYGISVTPLKANRLLLRIFFL